jgi:hypothetical protein
MNVTRPQKNKLRRKAVASSIVFAIAWCAPANPAQACSDLPNICAAQAQHNQQMNDIAATPQRNENGRYDGGGPASEQPRDPTAQAMADIYNAGEASSALGAELKEQMRDPKFKAAYDRYYKGGWDFFQDSNNPKPGEYCSALYAKGDVMVRISGPGSGYDGALMTFSGPGITGSRDVKKLKVTLNQSDGSSQSVQTFNYQLPGEVYASIAFAVPTIEAAMAAMEDKQGFDLLIKGKSVLKLDWHDGLAARKALEKCLSKRKSA